MAASSTASDVRIRLAAVVGHRRSHVVPPARDPATPASKSHHPVSRRSVLRPRVAFPRRPLAPDRRGTGDHDHTDAHRDDARAQARLGRAAAPGIRRRRHLVSVFAVMICVCSRSSPIPTSPHISSNTSASAPASCRSRPLALRLMTRSPSSSSPTEFHALPRCRLRTCTLRPVSTAQIVGLLTFLELPLGQLFRLLSSQGCVRRPERPHRSAYPLGSIASG